MPLQAITSTEPIPGYQIVERIGAGGYGEVWRANAPGGLVKAIKFVYGYLDEDRASRELKALTRIKDVRHPFLLSLERIEIVDGQLLIVTELADGSLKDRYDHCQEQGAVGIDRDEILSYMRDAADVLDYMDKEYSLQHLDIKPENLLLVGGRIKVADFGLVKDIHDATASMMGGLTPLYAPPEVFDGRPSHWSDQYSLAIVFQEMLTGELPFPGKTAVQLARQHLNARPRVNALPEEFRSTIAHALSKDPKERFANCRELVDQLLSGEAKGTNLAPPSPGGLKTGGSGGSQKRQTAVLQEVPLAKPSDTTSRVPVTHESPSVTTLKPLDVTNCPPRLRPTLFVGIGGAAGQVLARLVRRLNDRFGDLEQVPAYQFVLFDTDGKSLMTASQVDKSQTLSGQNMLCLPLRRPQEYKNDSRHILKWLSRRWLYNIPRSLKTEGLRPLGRLALVDNMEAVNERLSKSLRMLVDKEHIKASAEQTGLECPVTEPQVVLVSSISGGTGGGMFLDMAYAVRNLLIDLEVPDDVVNGILLHGTGRNARSSELSVVNSYASLVELNHFSRPGGYYPGDKAIGLPARDGDDAAPFRNTYLMHLGEELADTDLEEAAEKVAEYIYLDAATPAGAFFDKARDAATVIEAGDDTSLRTFGLHQLSCFQDDIVGSACERVCRGLAELWLTGSITTSTKAVPLSSADDDGSQVRVTPLLPKAELTKLAEEKSTQHELDAAKLIGRLFQMVENEFDEKPDAFFQREMKTIWESPKVAKHPERHAAWLAVTLQSLDRILGPFSMEDVSVSEPSVLETALMPQRRKYVLSVTEDVHDWIFGLVDRPDIRVRGAQTTTKILERHVEMVTNETDALARNVRNQLNQLHQQITSIITGEGRGRKSKIKQLNTQLLQYCRLRLYYFVLLGAGRLNQAIKGQLSQTQEDLLNLGRELKHLANQFSSASVLNEERDESAPRTQFDDLVESVTGVLDNQLPDLVMQLDKAAHEGSLDAKGGLVTVMTEGGPGRHRLPDELRGSARAVLANVMKNMNVAGMLFNAEDEGQDKTRDSMEQTLKRAAPSLLSCGGGKRLLVMLPAGSTDTRPLEILHREFNEVPSVVSNCDGDFVMCYEVEDMSLTQTAVHLIDGRRDFVQFAHWLFTRSDVSWASLPDLVYD